MSKNFEIALSLLLKGQQATVSGVRAVGRGISSMGDAARGATGEVKRLYDAANGFSTASKLIAFVGGSALLRDTENTVLAFQRLQFELKQTAGLSKDQVEQISNYSKESAAAMLSTPTAMIAGAVALANAGMKFETLSPVLKQAAKDAAAFRATVAEMANMDFDITTKMKIEATDLGAAHNMLLYHARSGRFEAPAMSRGAPELFTHASKVGLDGVKGLNLVGAMTQAVMKGIAPDQQSRVLTNFEQGFSHIVTPHYMKGLSKVGIDIQKYMPNGKFYGEGGVQGFTDLVHAMKAKGLENPFKMAKAGFADKETKDFWFQMMKGVDGFDAAMREAASAAKGGQTDKDRMEISGSAVGQDQQARANWEKRQLDGEGGVEVWEKLKNKAAENPLTTAAAVATAGLGVRMMWKNRQVKAAESSSVAGALNAQNVFVMNWPKSLGVAGALPPQGAPGVPVPAGTPEGKASKIGRVAVTSAAVLAEVAAVGYLSYQAMSAFMETDYGHRVADFWGDQILAVNTALDKMYAQPEPMRNPTKMAEVDQARYAILGNAGLNAQQPLEINLHLDGQQISTVVETRQKNVARRN